MKKKLLITLFLITSLKSFTQKLECCNSIQEVTESLEGNWIIKNDDSNSIYQFYFNGEIGGIYELKKEDLENGRIPIRSCKPVLKIIKNIFGYRIEFISMSGSVKAKIKHLDNKSFILSIKGNLVEYSRFGN
jgi:hypothetical protein